VLILQGLQKSGEKKAQAGQPREEKEKKKEKASS
jgi:hypothetical protein